MDIPNGNLAKPYSCLLETIRIIKIPNSVGSNAYNAVLLCNNLFSDRSDAVTQITTGRLGCMYVCACTIISNYRLSTRAYRIKGL